MPNTTIPNFHLFLFNPDYQYSTLAIVLLDIMDTAHVVRYQCDVCCDLPLELFYWIQEHVDINNLLLTTSRLTAYRRQLYRWRLTERNSLAYL